jgi:hypothetical protein
MLDNLVGWFDTPRLVAFGVAAVGMYMFWGPDLVGAKAGA